MPLIKFARHGDKPSTDIISFNTLEEFRGVSTIISILQQGAMLGLRASFIS